MGYRKQKGNGTGTNNKKLSPVYGSMTSMYGVHKPSGDFKSKGNGVF